MANIRGKSHKALAMDIAEGYISVNPLFLKPFAPDILKGLYQEIEKAQISLRTDKFPAKDIGAIRIRNLKLQRLYLATVIIRTFAREHRIPLA